MERDRQVNLDGLVSTTILVPHNGREVVENPCPTSPIPSPIGTSFTLRPGEVDTYSVYMCAWQEQRLTCSELLKVVLNEVKPGYSPSGIISTFSSTNFDVGTGGGFKEGLGQYDNPFTMGFWMPNVKEYQLTMKGLACGSQYLVEHSATIKVEHPVISFLEEKSKCPPTVYSPEDNTIGLTGANPVFPDKKGCSIAYTVRQGGYKAQYGFLQVMEDGDIEINGKDASGLQFNFEALALEGSAVDYRKNETGYRNTITFGGTVAANQGSQILYTGGTTSFFTAPFFSQTCNGTDSITVHHYQNYLTQYYNYLMMKVEPQEGKVSNWVPVRMAGWFSVSNAKCDTPPCGMGLGEESGSPYRGSWRASYTYSKDPKFMAYWVDTPDVPVWNAVVQDAYRVTAVSKLDNMDYWLSCPVFSLGIRQGGRSPIKQSITVYPGKITDFSAYGKFGVKDAQGNTLCKEALSDITAAFSPAVNAAGEPTALLMTTYADADKKGKVKAVKFGKTLDSLKFAVWDPHTDSYSLQMSGTACGKAMSFDFDIKVDRGDVTFNPQHSKFPSPAIDYSLKQNLAGDVAVNGFTNLPGTSISYLVKQPASHSADYGFIQLSVGSSFVQGVSGDRNDLQDDQIMVLGETDGPAVACSKEIGAANEEIQRTIFQPVRVEAGATKEIAFTSSPHLFTAPYFSTAGCSGQSATRASEYYSGVEFITYLVQKPVVAAGEESYWIPVKKVDWAAEFGVACVHDYCGLGLGTEKTPFVNPWQITASEISQPKLDSAWVLKPTLPTWDKTVQQATSSSLYKVSDGREGEYHSNYYVFCPKGAAGESVEQISDYEYLYGQEVFVGGALHQVGTYE